MIFTFKMEFIWIDSIKDLENSPESLKLHSSSIKREAFLNLMALGLSVLIMLEIKSGS